MEAKTKTAPKSATVRLVDKAKTLLETTDLAVAEVAARTGFATVQHFSRIFSSVANVSPRKYRQQRVNG